MIMEKIQSLICSGSSLELSRPGSREAGGGGLRRSASICDIRPVGSGSNNYYATVRKQGKRDQPEVGQTSDTVITLRTGKDAGGADREKQVLGAPRERQLLLQRPPGPPPAPHPRFRLRLCLPRAGSGRSAHRKILLRSPGDCEETAGQGGKHGRARPQSQVTSPTSQPCGAVSAQIER